MNTKVLVLSLCSKEGKIKKRWYVGSTKTEFSAHVKRNRKFQGEKHPLWSIFLCQKHICKLSLDTSVTENGIGHFLRIFFFNAYNSDIDLIF